MSEAADKVGELLRNIFPSHTILREYTIKVGRGILYLDFYLPQAALAIEYDGAQHRNYNPFFHKSRDAFRASQNRDRLKEDWCLSAGISLIRITDRDAVSEEILKRKLVSLNGT